MVTVTVTMTVTSINLLDRSVPPFHDLQVVRFVPPWWTLDCDVEFECEVCDVEYRDDPWNVRDHEYQVDRPWNMCDHEYQVDDLWNVREHEVEDPSNVPEGFPDLVEFETQLLAELWWARQRAELPTFWDAVERHARKDRHSFELDISILRAHLAARTYVGECYTLLILSFKFRRECAPFPFPSTSGPAFSHVK